jgi:hypothetical protein
MYYKHNLFLCQTGALRTNTTSHRRVVAYYTMACPHIIPLQVTDYVQILHFWVNFMQLFCPDQPTLACRVPADVRQHVPLETTSIAFDNRIEVMFQWA